MSDSTPITGPTRLTEPPAQGQADAAVTSSHPDFAPLAESWHWQRRDPLGGLYSRFPFKLLIHDQVGLDVGSSWLKYAVTRHGAGQPRLLSAGGVPIVAHGAGQMGKIRAQIGALLAVRDKVPRGPERWIVGVTGQGTMVRTVEVPKMPRRELRKAVLWQAQKKIPFPLEDAHVAIQFLKSGPGQPVRAIVSAAIKRLVDDLLYLLAEAEIRPSAVTLPAFGLGRILNIGGLIAPGECYGLLDIGAEHCLFAVYRGRQMEFYREIDLGVVDVEEALALELKNRQPNQQADTRQASAILFDRGLGPAQDAFGTGDLSAQVHDSLEQLLLEIQNTLEYYAAGSGGVRINKFFILGGGSQIPGIERHLGQVLETPVELLNPLGRGPDAAYASAHELVTPARWASAYGFSLLPRHTSNLLPPDYVHEQEAEFRSLLWRSATGTAVAVSVILSGGEYYRGQLATHRAEELAVNLGETTAQLDALGGPRTEATLAANQRWLSALARKDIRATPILQQLSLYTPSQIALDRLDIRPNDSGWADLDLTGEVRAPHDQNEVILAEYVDRLARTGFFHHLSLDQYASIRKADYEQLSFHLALRAPLEERTP
jgi:type IV pilus assembly protein PilM